MNGDTYLDMQKNWLMERLREEDSDNFIRTGWGTTTREPQSLKDSEHNTA